MKKFLVIFIGLIMIAPAWAEDPIVLDGGNNGGSTPTITQYLFPTTASTQGSAIVSANAPKYDLETISATDQGHIASTAYVKGAHNSVLSVVNYLSDNKQAKLTNDASGTISSIVRTSLRPTTTATNTELATELAVATALADKQATLGNTNVVLDSNASTGSFVTGVTASAGVVTVSKGEVTIPVGAASGSGVTGHSQLWVN